MASMVIEAEAAATAVAEPTQALRGSSCACGQDLDCCHRAHCPRCGTTLHG